MIHLLYYEAQQPGLVTGLSLKRGHGMNMKTNQEQNAGASWSVNLVPLPSREFLISRLDYDPETGSIKWKTGLRKGMEAGCKQRRRDGSPNAIRIGFAGLDGTLIQYVAHRLIFLILEIDVPLGMVIDHEDGNPFNNKRSNLRLATHANNLWNARRKNLRKKHNYPTGVFKSYKRFAAKICVNGQIVFLGSYPTPEEAGEAYASAFQRHCGQFAPSTS